MLITVVKLVWNEFLKCLSVLDSIFNPALLCLFTLKTLIWRQKHLASKFSKQSWLLLKPNINISIAFKVSLIFECSFVECLNHPCHKHKRTVWQSASENCKMTGNLPFRCNDSWPSLNHPLNNLFVCPLCLWANHCSWNEDHLSACWLSLILLMGTNKKTSNKPANEWLRNNVVGTHADRLTWCMMQAKTEATMGLFVFFQFIELCAQWVWTGATYSLSLTFPGCNQSCDWSQNIFPWLYETSFNFVNVNSPLLIALNDFVPLLSFLVKAFFFMVWVQRDMKFWVWWFTLIPVDNDTFFALCLHDSLFYHLASKLILLIFGSPSYASTLLWLHVVTPLSGRNLHQDFAVKFFFKANMHHKSRFTSTNLQLSNCQSITDFFNL